MNNAGGQFAAAAEDISLKGLRAVHRLSVDAVWHLTHEVATRWMIPREQAWSSSSASARDAASR